MGASPNNLPPRNPQFAGRADELNELHQSLASDRCVAITQMQPDFAGGTGKSALAIEYAWSHQKDYPGGMLMVSGASLSLFAQYSALAVPLKIPAAPQQRATCERVRMKLESTAPSLLIFDQFDDADHWFRLIKSHLIPAGNCRLLVTTRRASLCDTRAFPLARMSRADGERMLAAYRSDALQSDVMSGDIVDWLDGLPAALVVVGSMMKSNADLGRQQLREQLDALRLGAVGSGKSPATPADAEQRLNSIFRLLLDALQPEHRRALEYASLLPPGQAMSRWLIDLLGSDPSLKLAKLPGQPMREPKTVLWDLLSMQLLSARTPGRQILVLHPVFQHRLNEMFDAEPEHRDGLLDRVAELAADRVKSSAAAMKNKSLRIELEPLLELARDVRERGRLALSLQLANALTPVLNRLGWHEQLIALLDGFCYEPMLKRLEPSDAAIVLSNRAVSLSAVGRMPEARDQMERALQLEQRHLEPLHPNLATRHSNLAAIFKRMGDNVKARRHIQHAIEIDVKHFGAEHPNLALRYWWLGDIELAEGHREKACAQYRRAYAIVKKHFPADHRQVLTLEKLIHRHCDAQSD